MQIIDFVLIDLDLSSFGHSKQALDKWLANKILKNIKEIFSFNFEPTVIWSGNGYHIHIQFEPLNQILEEMKEFAVFKNASIEFLRFIEKFLSIGKCDPSHNNSVAFSNCMLRIPNKKEFESISVHKISLIFA